MNSLKTLKLSRRIAAAFAAVGLAAGAIGAPLTSSTGGVVFDIPGTPDNGMACRSGYTPNFNGKSLTCSKVVTVTVALACLDPVRSIYVARAAGTGGSPEGLDICVKANGKVQIDSATDISNMKKGTDYEFAKVDPAKVTEKTATQDQAEATALGLLIGEVDTIAGDAVVVKNKVGIIDKADVPMTQFTFPVVNGPIFR